MGEKSRDNWIIPFCIKRSRCANNKKCSKCLNQKLFKERKKKI